MEKIGSPDRLPLSEEQEAVLGEELVQDLNLIRLQLEPYEEWAVSGDCTTNELLQVLKEDGIFKDLRIIGDLMRALRARYRERKAALKKRYGGTPPEKVLQREAVEMTRILFGLRGKDHPLFTEIIAQVFDASELETYVAFAEVIREKRKSMSPDDQGGVLEYKAKQKIEAGMKPNPVMANLNSILVFLGSRKQTFAEVFTEPKEESSGKVTDQFKQFRWVEWEEMPLSQLKGRELRFRKDQRLNMTVWVRPVSRNVFESFEVLVQFPIDVPSKEHKGFLKKVPVVFKLSLSKVHSELCLPLNGYVSLEPLFQTYGLAGFYHYLKGMVWGLVEEEVTRGTIKRKQVQQEVTSEIEAPSEVEVNSEAIVPQQAEQVAESVATVLEEEKPRKKFEKGVRQTARNIPIEQVVATLEKMGITVQRNNGSSHVILVGTNAQDGKPRTMPVPLGARGDNSSPYIANAAQTFGFTRKEFLTALSEL